MSTGNQGKCAAVTSVGGRLCDKRQHPRDIHHGVVQHGGQEVQAVAGQDGQVQAAAQRQARSHSAGGQNLHLDFVCKAEMMFLKFLI